MVPTVHNNIWYARIIAVVMELATNLQEYVRVSMDTSDWTVLYFIWSAQITVQEMDSATG
jgi:hypothetical protein